MINILNVDHINFMAIIKSYTDIEQSKKLAEILPPESADMVYIKHATSSNLNWRFDDDIPPMILGKTSINDMTVEVLPAWSLAALLKQLPYELCDDDGNSSYLQMNKEDDMYQLEYIDPSEIFESIETDRHEHFVDTCYEMILKLKELNLL